MNDKCKTCSLELFPHNTQFYIDNGVCSQKCLDEFLKNYPATVQKVINDGGKLMTDVECPEGSIFIMRKSSTPLLDLMEKKFNDITENTRIYLEHHIQNLKNEPDDVDEPKVIHILPSCMNLLEEYVSINIDKFSLVKIIKNGEVLIEIHNKIGDSKNES